MNANELAEIIQHLENAKYVGASKAAIMLRAQQEQIEELEKENTDLRYLIATKLEQQDGISLNSMAHPITNTPEPSYEIDPNKLETIEIDLPSPKPVAWMSDESFEVSTLNIGRFSIPLYTHPAKTLTPLTDDECEAIINRHDWFSKSWREMAKEIHDAILRKAQEK